MEDKPINDYDEEWLSLTSNSADENQLNTCDITTQRVGRIENQFLWKELNSEDEAAQVMML